MSESVLVGEHDGLEEYLQLKGIAEVDPSVPPELRPSIYGEKIISPVRYGDLIMLSQTRETANPENDNLQDSISRSGLINQPDIAKMPADVLGEYVEFVNRIWGADHHMDQLPQAVDGYYYLVIAGHSRIISIGNIENERAEAAHEQGFETNPEDTVVYCKIQDAPTPEAIIALQLEENIHHQVPKERQAMCLVETYLYGLENGTWDGPTEFARHSDGRFSSEDLRKAMLFAQLPSSAREQVLVGELKYSTAVELARTYPDFMRFCLHKYFENTSYDDLNEVQRIELEMTTLEWLGKEIATIQSKRLNVTASKRRLESLRENWSAVIDQDNGNHPQLFMTDPSEEFRRFRRQQRDEYRRIVQSLKEGSLKRTARAIQLHDQLALSEDEGLEVVESQRREFKAQLGKTAIQKIQAA